MARMEESPIRAIREIRGQKPNFAVEPRHVIGVIRWPNSKITKISAQPLQLLFASS